MSWRETILKEFVREAGRLTLVADPDGLLAEEGVLNGLQQRGFELLTFEDPVEFRLAYEGRYRQAWDRGEDTEVVVALRAEASNTDHLPFDLVATGRRLDFNLARLFPLLSPAVLDRLDRGLLDRIEEAVATSGITEEHGDQKTRDFVLTWIYQWSPSLTTPERLVAWLLSHHYRRLEMPQVLVEHAVRILNRLPGFKDWKLTPLLADRAAFFSFLQGQWTAFLDRQAVTNKVAEPGSSYAGADCLVPFQLDSIKPLLDNCFAEGLLQPVSHLAGAVLALRPGLEWISAGLERTRTQADLTGLLQQAKERVPAATDSYVQWQQYGITWAAARAGVARLPAADRQAVQPALASLRKVVDERFRAWALARFGLLASLPASPPAQVHQIAKWLAHRREGQPRLRQALVVLDGLALDQWMLVKQHLAQRQPTWEWGDHTVFAWVPTLTKVSRLSIFTGQTPLFGGLDGSIDLEQRGWRRFWTDQEMPAHAIAYANCSLRTSAAAAAEIAEVREQFSQALVAGLVVRAVDELMHGEGLGEAGLIRQLQEWLDRSQLENLLIGLLEDGFTITLTSDHGNVEADGIGKPAQGVLVDERGERACLYRNPAFRTQALAAIPTSFAWSDTGLPPGNHYLLAGGRSAFLHPKDNRVVHGGLTLDEVLVPCVSLRSGAAP